MLRICSGGLDDFMAISTCRRACDLHNMPDGIAEISPAEGNPTLQGRGFSSHHPAPRIRTLSMRTEPLSNMTIALLGRRANDNLSSWLRSRRLWKTVLPMSGEAAFHFAIFGLGL
jgi:hypothetical protein